MANKPKNTDDGKTTTTQQQVDQQLAADDKSVLDQVAITNGVLQRQFSYVKPDDEQVEQIQRVRKAAAAFAQIVKDNSPNCPDQSAAIRKIREATMTANAAIVLRGK